MFRKKNDVLLKAAFEETFAYLLRFFFADADGIFDFTRGFVFMDKELRELFPELETSGGTRQVDMLAKVFLLDGTEKWILVHIEIQEQYKSDFPKRMFKYFYRIYDRYQVGVTAIAVFTGKSKPVHEHFIEHLLGTEATYKYNTYHILDHSETELIAMNNPFALVVLAAQKALLAEKIPQEEINESRLTIAKALINSGQFSHPQILQFLFFLKSFLHIDNKEINAIFDKQTDTLTGKTSAMGIIETIKMIEREEGMEKGLEKGMQKGMQKGMEKGIEQSKTEFVKTLLATNRFTTAEIANFANVAEAFVNRVEKELK